MKRMDYFNFFAIFVEPGDEEEDDADADVGEGHAAPDLGRQRGHEAEDSWALLHGLLDHDGDAQGHKGFGEVSHLNHF